MAEVLMQVDTPVSHAGGQRYVARVCGRQTEDGLWKGWIEFVAEGGAPVLRTPRETKQPNRADLEYWATGLTVPYLEGALERALDPATPDLRPRSVTVEPRYDRPAPSSPEGVRPAAPPPIQPDTVLDPFAVFAQGEDILREELGALDEGHLRNIIRAHELVGEDELDLRAIDRPALAELILAGVRKRAT